MNGLRAHSWVDDVNLLPDKAGEKAAEEPKRREAMASFMVIVGSDNNSVYYGSAAGSRQEDDATQGQGKRSQTLDDGLCVFLLVVPT